MSSTRVLAAAATAQAHHHITSFQAVVIGLLQGVTELFPISSLGHSVLVPALIGGSWREIATQQSGESPYLAFLVGLHVATALVLLAYFWRDWVRVFGGFFSSIRNRRIETSAERLAWLLVAVTIPVGVLGLLFEHKLRTVFAKPTAAAAFLMCNGVILLAGERMRRKVAPGQGKRQLDTLDLKEGIAIGFGQSLALLAGISRSGVTMVAGLVRGLDHEDAAHFAFLAATPVILAAGVYKLGDLTGPLGNGIRGQILIGSACAAVGALVAVRFLERFFRTQTLTPFAVYSLLFGGFCVLRFTAFA